MRSRLFLWLLLSNRKLRFSISQKRFALDTHLCEKKIVVGDCVWSKNVPGHILCFNEIEIRCWKMGLLYFPVLVQALAALEYTDFQEKLVQPGL